MMQKLLKSMQTGASKAKSHSVNTIIYAWRRADAESLSQFLSAQGFAAGCYHAGLSSSQRSKMQQQFESGQLKIIVATIAFGMGIDKADVTAVIHTYLPSSVEDYVQQTGRAGRNGQLSHCYLLIDDESCISQHALAYAHTPSRLQVMAFLSNIFRLLPSKPEKTTPGTSNQPCRLQSHVCFSLSAVARMLDCPEATVQTYLAVFERGCSGKDIVISVTNESHLNRVQGSFRDLKDLPVASDAQNDVRSSIMIALRRRSQGIEFDVSLFELSQELNLTTKLTVRELYALQQEGFIQYNLSDPAYLVTLSSSSQSDLIIFDSTEQYWEWFSSTSRQLCETLEALDRLNAKRVLDMRAMAKVIESASNVDSGVDLLTDEQSHDERQHQLRDLLNSYMEGRIQQVESSYPVPTNPLVSAFANMPSILKNSADIENQARKDAMVLVRDPNLLSTASAMSTSIISCFGIDFDLQEMRKQHIALTAFKIMYGALASTAGNGHPTWRGSSYWGKCKNLDPNKLLQLCLASTGTACNGTLGDALDLDMNTVN
jgi:hypothetical protein